MRWIMASSVGLSGSSTSAKSSLYLFASMFQMIWWQKSWETSDVCRMN